MPSEALLQSQVPGFPCRRGKVRDVYDLGETLAIVATDRISAFDYILSPPIPEKGRLLTAMSIFWFNWLKVPNHLISTDLADLPREFRQDALRGRTMLVRKTTVVPIECVARGYILGSGWKEYKATGTVCGITLPAGLREASKLPEPILTPTTKEEGGKHDESISFERMAELVGLKTATELRDRTLDVYRRAASYAEGRGIILADTKLEWGRLPGGELILIDEVLTPDSSRFWPKDTYRVGSSPPSFDKQFVRDYLETTAWDKASPPPTLPAEVVEKTAAKYREALDRLTAGA
jgi:phosphoribosylaminoimidazole-succinocarboxamide synthase